MLPLLNADAAPVADAGQTPTSAGQMSKVELDLEGAPFLEPEPKADPVPTAASKPALKEEKEEPAPNKKRKKLFIILGAVLPVFLAALGAVYFLFLRAPGSTHVQVDAPPGVEVVVIPSTPPELPVAPASAYNLSWPPFWVEVMDPEGDLRFIYCKFTLLTDNPRISMQLKAKNTTLRDATYYFLRHKPYAELANLRRLDTLKEELMNVINYYILPEQVQARGPDGALAPVNPPQMERVRDILIEDYLIK